jgi:SAM-dependent methyltransferase
MTKPIRPWFSTPGRQGDRTLRDQLKGLDPLFAEVAGKTVLDAGCAEGLIAIELAKAGAAAVHGVEFIRERVDFGMRAKGDLPVTLETGDLNTWSPKRQYDIVIGLAILHKLRDPSTVAARLADASRDLVVWRLPPKDAPLVIDARSGNVEHHIGDMMDVCGFTLERESYGGHLGEWMGYYRRK